MKIERDGLKVVVTWDDSDADKSLRKTFEEETSATQAAKVALHAIVDNLVENIRIGQLAWDEMADKIAKLASEAPDTIGLRYDRAAGRFHVSER